MRPDERQRSERGVSDGLLVGLIAFLLGLTLLVWSATGLAAVLSHGAWPQGVTFTRTPEALRHLATKPSDVPGAWPTTPTAQLSGWGLFWGLFIGQLMVLFVLTIFVVGTLARWKAVRTARRTPHEVPVQRTERPPETQPEPVPEPTELPPPPEPSKVFTTAPVAADGKRVGGWESIFFGTQDTRTPPATQAIQNAEGPALILTSNPTLWQETKDARAKLGPILLYDPTHLCDTPARLHWPPTTGCEDKPTAAARAAALLTPVRPTAKIDRTTAETAETLLRSYLHAAAIDTRTIRHVHRWAQGTNVQEAVRILRTNPKAAPGAAGELEAALTAHPERRDMAQELTSRALAALSTVNIREACTANRSDALALDSFIAEGGTLYVVGEPIEDPRTNPGAMPLLTALTASVVERGRRMAERSSSGRLDPPMTLVLDDVAAVAPLPQLPDLLTTGADHGMPTLALLRSKEQLRARWPDHDLPVQ
ncbi:type IV secretory system conjugative DNA transfer family protein [Streptomyces sp. WI04-05B]|uniref:type IV secretory system conjugative DNA transfer family protein n=1 Tax=Streptomyces TaxID=1883 RepID=UPI0029AA8F80|nr:MULTISPECIES: type IV secretory system conjugative DNA transfer family protein [unclassified Streptomyces]MDX2548940.1 type IV secretory system conjugative DNA transfer family protein [Streptomyces sp. WI04-05B]MDX2590567.1 type IV secretory system conjugative DNA transfer family protein [Streptomyces sp. WI04-05A]